MSSTTESGHWPSATPQRADNVEIAPLVSEDWLSVVIGLFIFVLALAGIANLDLIGWAVTTSVWTDPGKALGLSRKAYASLGGAGALVATYVALLVVLSGAAVALKSDVKKFALAFTAVFWIAYASWIVGSYASFAAVTPADLQKFGISWSLKLTNEGGFIFALVAGLIIGNVFPRFAEWIKDAVRPELYIKVAIVILGGFFAVTARASSISTPPTTPHPTAAPLSPRTVSRPPTHTPPPLAPAHSSRRPQHPRPSLPPREVPPPSLLLRASRRIVEGVF